MNNISYSYTNVSRTTQGFTGISTCESIWVKIDNKELAREPLGTCVSVFEKEYVDVVNM